MIDSPPVWVTLTTIPSRLERTLSTLESLKRQTYPVTRINLCLPDFCQKQNRGYDIPSALLEDPAITVVRCGTDWGPATKLLGSLAICYDPNTLIIMVDDDILYAPDIVEKLVTRHLAHPEAAIGFCGWYAHHAKQGCRAMYDNLVYEDLHPEISFMTEVDILEGYRGVLTRRDFWDDAVFDYTQAPAESRFVDDVWFSGHLARRKIPRLAFRYDSDRSLDFDTTYYKIWVSNFNGLKKDNDSLSCRDNFYGENVATLRYFERFDPALWLDESFHKKQAALSPANKVPDGASPDQVS